MRDLAERLLLAIAPAVATEVTRYVLDQRKAATVQPSNPAPSFAAYVGRQR